MPKITMVDELTAPSGEIHTVYKGQNPFIPVAMARGLLKDIMKISSKDIFETDVRWDVTGDPRGFYGQWMGKRKEDRWTITKIRIIIQGEQSSKDKTGWCRVILKGSLETSYNFSNFIQRAFWWFYNYGFYYKQRRMYLEYSKDNIFEMREKFMDALGISREGK
jgi:hypothetical protein